jgi:hypothetical protein
MRYRLVVAFAYVTALGWFAYASDEVIPNWVAFAAIFVAPFVAGFLVGRLWAVALPAVVVLIAVRAGQRSGEVSPALGMMFVGLIAVPAIVIGWGARWLADRFVIR